MPPVQASYLSSRSYSYNVLSFSIFENKMTVFEIEVHYETAVKVVNICMYVVVVYFVARFYLLSTKNKFLCLFISTVLVIKENLAL